MSKIQLRGVCALISISLLLDFSQCQNTAFENGEKGKTILKDKSTSLGKRGGFKSDITGVRFSLLNSLLQSIPE